jgi:hypothetical protein
MSFVPEVDEAKAMLFVEVRITGAYIKLQFANVM